MSSDTPATPTERTCEFSADAADQLSLKVLAEFTQNIMLEIDQLHHLMSTATQDQQSTEFQTTEMRTLRDLIQQKYALLRTVDHIRLDFFDQ